MIDHEMELKLYQKCIESGITLISITHNHNLLQFHDSLLLLDGKGSYTFSSLR
jgi:ABC-type uncharacterized transport system fused permease/ATPase subunit